MKDKEVWIWENGVDELFYIIKGRFRFTVGEKAFVAVPGDVVRGKMDIPHTFENISDEPGVFLGQRTEVD
jgi:mannose-6-phosphate isomerase-like protein (cupin superfamily)